ncbi:hypothetical protein [Chitinolyticbacter meiyuanensis]|uniref:hypothetical protein n=1 Tax=Chitinolyticbacter meiyuanensis TaxID=682798 RepID=UPI0011E5B5E5|nr:hypothetical protein [Chitinolyticbacter meiyuanensis]
MTRRALPVLFTVLLAACGGGEGSDDAAPQSAAASSPSPTPAVVPATSHGARYVIQGSGFGSKADYNTDNHRYFGQRHLLARFSDFDNAVGGAPASNTKAGWQAQLDGIYPILTSTDFNSQATASGATVQLSGGVTHSGRWLRRQITQSIRDAYPANYRLRNWNLWERNGDYPQLYVSCYVNLSTIAAPGKFMRFYWTNSNVINHNVWVAKEGSTLTARAEGSNDGMPGLYADPPAGYSNNRWMRYEILADFANDRIAFYADGQLLRDVSRNYHGEISGWLGTSGRLNYFLLSNTVDMNGEAGEFIGHAMPYLDFSHRRIELADSAVWAERSRAVVQVPTRWTDSQIDIVLNQGDFADLRNKHLFLLDGMTARYLGPLR